MRLKMFDAERTLDGFAAGGWGHPLAFMFWRRFFPWEPGYKALSAARGAREGED